MINTRLYVHLAVELMACLIATFFLGTFAFALPFIPVDPSPEQTLVLQGVRLVALGLLVTMAIYYSIHTTKRLMSRRFSQAHISKSMR